MKPIDNLIKEIQSNVEWLDTLDGQEIECISMENLESALSQHFELKIKLTIK